MGIYGFCLVLKAFRNHGMMRSISNRMGPTQISISGFSVMSQQTLGSGSNAASAFDMHVLEIIGILRKCFSQKYEIKEILYDGLSNAIQHNHRLIPHVLQFLDWHFRSYFNELGEYLEIDFEKCVSESGEPKVVQLNDHIGKLLHFMAFCLVLLEIHGLDYDSADLKEFFERLLEKIDSVNMEQIGLVKSFYSSFLFHFWCGNIFSLDNLGIINLFYVLPTFFSDECTDANAMSYCKSVSELYRRFDVLYPENAGSQCKYGGSN